MALSAQQEKFAQSVASGMSQSDAYREAYKVKLTTKPESVNQSASRLMADINIASRVEVIRQPVVKAAQITLETHLNDLKGLRNMATKAAQFSAAISAEVARGKASGLYLQPSYLDELQAKKLERELQMDVEELITTSVKVTVQDASKRSS